MHVGGFPPTPSVVATTAKVGATGVANTVDVAGAGIRAFSGSSGDSE